MLNPALIVRRRRTSGAVAVAPSEVWPPSGSPDLYFDFDLGEGYWGGSSKVRSDFIIDVDDGYKSTYRVLWGDLGIASGVDYTMMIEMYNDTLAPDATTVNEVFELHSTSTSYTAFKNYMYDNPRGYSLTINYSQRDPIASNNVPRSNMTTGNDTCTTQGIQRVLVSREQGADTKIISSLGSPYAMGITNTNVSHPAASKYVYINQKKSANADAVGTPNTDGTPIKRVAIWGRALTDNEMFTISRFGRPGIVFSGDSFVAGGNLRQEFVKTVEALGKGPVAVAYDGVGNTGLTAHAARWDAFVAANAKWADEYLIIMDGGFETVDGIAAAKAAIDSYLSNITHDRWVFVEPNPINPIGDSRRDEWNDFFYGAADNTGARELYNYIGPKHYIKTYDAMQAANDGSPEDLADIANGLWPRSLTGDGTHLNDAGLAVFGPLIADYAVAESWV